jgi:hypothetical protein
MGYTPSKAYGLLLRRRVRFILIAFFTDLSTEVVCIICP